ncbi:MAG: chorismate-binding protein [Alphaproteobacteria bacterium]|nr:chorismate-binding protein [Alphaproteobacteria bacterium]
MPEPENLNRLFDPARPFALIKRRDDAQILYLSGKIAHLDRLAQIPRKKGKPASGAETFDSLSILPFRQVEELGFTARHQSEKIISMQVETQHWFDPFALIAALPTTPVDLSDEGAFAPNDDDYAASVARVIETEIGNGEGCNFVIPRRFRARIRDFGMAHALSSFRRILENEYGVYWSFLYYTGAQYFIGATPERHLSCHKGTVKMNPISGTFRKTEHAPAALVPALQKFLRDPKEMFELLMVTDEELKMMAEICSSGGQVVGPMLKEMSKLIHTEYVLAGRSDRDIIAMLRESMFAATVTGGPIENACRVIARHDPESRRYYGSALALIGRDEDGGDTLDSPITIRMAEIAPDGAIEIGVGATLVRNSVPRDEVAETYAKAAGVMAALGLRRSEEVVTGRLGENLYSEDVMLALSSRNTRLSRFWIEEQSAAADPSDKVLRGKRVTIIDNEDNFTRMMKHIIGALGASVKIIRYDRYDASADDADIVILGPGPGDPRDESDAKMQKIAAICRGLLEGAKPFLSVCLGHQILCRELGIELVRKQSPFQGVQQLIPLWGAREYVGFYNTFAGKFDGDDHGLDISYDEPTGEIHALRGRHFAGVQFHPESILTTNGFRILRDILEGLSQKITPPHS